MPLERPSRRPRGRLCALALALAAVAPPARAQGGDSVFTVAHYLDYETVADPQLSRDGSRVVFTRRYVNTLEDRWESALWIMNADGSRQRFFARGANPVWSPDGTRIAYLAEGEPKGTQVFVRYVDDNGPPTQITRVTEPPANLRWSPDGRAIGFSMTVPKPETWAIDLPRAPEGARWTKAPRYVERLHYRQDRVGFTERGHTHLFLVGAEGGTPRQLTTGDWHVGFRFDGLSGGVSWDFTPDGAAVITDGYREGDPDRNYRQGHVYRVEVATGAVTRLTPAAGSWQGPVLSPDGRTIAFVGAPNDTAVYALNELYTMQADGSGMTRRSAGLDREPRSLAWAPDGATLYFLAEDEGSVQLFGWSAVGGARRLTTAPQVLSGLSVGRGVVVTVRSTALHPPDVVRLDPRRPADVAQLTRVNDDILGGLALGSVEELWVRSADGTRVQGWVVKPPRFDPARRYPMLLEIHGGPQAMYTVGFNPGFQQFAAAGYLVAYFNPRGSTGYGEAFTQAIGRAYPSVDHDDLMAAVDSVVARGWADPARLYVGGCSGGGVLSSWATTRTDRFAAAAVRCPVTNWISMFGQTDIPGFTLRFFDRPFWEDPTDWLARSSLLQAGRVRTPTLLMTGELDLRTPMAQTEEYYAVLKARGVPSALLRFEGEYHGTGSRPSNWMRTQLYMLSWFQRFAPGRTTSPP